MVAKCHLEFDGFDSFLVNALRKIFEANVFPDVTLVGDDEFPIEAHRIILTAHSSVLERAIVESKSTKPTLHLKGFNYQDLTFLMQYLYLGEVSVPFAQASELLKMGKYLQINQLGDECNVTDKDLNKMFSVVPKDDFANSDSFEDSSVVDDGDTGKELTHPSELVTTSEDEYLEDEPDEDECKTYSAMDKEYILSMYSSYKSTEDEGENSEEPEYDSSQVKDENDDERSPLQCDGKAEVTGKQMNGKYPGKGDDIEGPDYGPDMVGKPLPDFSVLRSVTFSHYYFVKSKPINGEAWARCNICWYKLGTGAQNVPGQSVNINMPFLRIAGVGKKWKKQSYTTTPMITHINSRHPDFMDQFMHQQAETTKACKILQQNKKITQIQLKEEKITKKDLIREKKRIEYEERAKLKINRKTNTFNRIEKLKTVEPNYDFEHVDEDIMRTVVGAPKDNHSPSESVVYSHNFFRKLYPKKAKNKTDKTSLNSSIAECVTCAQRNDRHFLKTNGGSTSGLLNHIRAHHPELNLQLKKIQNGKSDILSNIRVQKQERLNMMKETNLALSNSYAKLKEQGSLNLNKMKETNIALLTSYAKIVKDSQSDNI